jgi:hypothetical protein
MKVNRILGVHNKLRLAPVTWLSFAIRVFTCSWINHIAIDYTDDNGVRKVIESTGGGVEEHLYEDWFGRSDRFVLELFVDEGVIETNLQGAINLLGTRYGTLDLVQILFWIIRTKWFGSDNDWNGVDGVGRWDGVICSELGGIVLRVSKSYLLLPRDFEYMRGLIKGQIFETKKIKKATKPS